MQLSPLNLYPYIVFIHARVTKKVYAVKINKYTEAISISAFERLNLRTAYKLANQKNSLSVYKGTFTTLDDQMVKSLAEDFPEKSSYVAAWRSLQKLVKSPTDLPTFYKEIGYNPKTKKIKGYTFNQWLLKYMSKTDS